RRRYRRRRRRNGGKGHLRLPRPGVVPRERDHARRLRQGGAPYHPEACVCRRRSPACQTLAGGAGEVRARSRRKRRGLDARARADRRALACLAVPEQARALTERLAAQPPDDIGAWWMIWTIS